MELTSRSLQLGRRIRHMGRLAQITNTFARHGLWSVAERLGLEKWLTPEQVREAQELSRGTGEGESESGGPGSGDSFDVSQVKGMPARLRRSFEELGPAFVKLGQVLAVREDLLPREYIEELRKLHTGVAPLPFATIRQVLTDELGAERLAQFKMINEKPLAAGSIAQVHEAELQSGRKVVVKVQRPGIDHQIKVDLSLMTELAGLVEKFIPETRLARPVAMFEEFARALLGELDFVREGGNITKIARNFGGVAHIQLPEVVWPLTTSRVMTQSFMEGLPAWDRERLVQAGLDPSLLVERGLGMFLKMVFVDGLYHGDLHPGNILALPGNRVGVIDFGLTVHVGRSTRENLASLLLALIEEDFARVVMHYAELADPGAAFDAEGFEHEVGNAVAPFIGLSLADLRTGRLFWDVARAAAKHGAPMPQELVVFIKTLVPFEGIGTHLDPSFDVLASAEKFSSQIAAEFYSADSLKQQSLTIARDFGQLAKHAPLQIRRLLKAALEGELSLTIKSEEATRLAVALDRSSSRLAISLIVAALIVGSSIVTFERSGQGPASVSHIGLVGFALAGLLGVYVIVSILRGGRM
jgi:ubiquinone biosynthesis protein